MLCTIFLSFNIITKFYFTNCSFRQQLVPLVGRDVVADAARAGGLPSGRSFAERSLAGSRAALRRSSGGLRRHALLRLPHLARLPLWRSGEQSI